MPVSQKADAAGGISACIMVLVNTAFALLLLFNFATGDLGGLVAGIYVVPFVEIDIALLALGVIFCTGAGTVTPGKEGDADVLVLLLSITVLPIIFVFALTFLLLSYMYITAVTYRGLQIADYAVIGAVLVTAIWESLVRLRRALGRKHPVGAKSAVIDEFMPSVRFLVLLVFILFTARTLSVDTSALIALSFAIWYAACAVDAFRRCLWCGKKRVAH